MQWIITNWVEISAAVALLIAFADKVAKLTPTNADNDAIDTIKRLLDKIKDPKSE
jgi:hypothetical protein